LGGERERKRDGRGKEEGRKGGREGEREGGMVIENATSIYPLALTICCKYGL